MINAKKGSLLKIKRVAFSKTQKTQKGSLFLTRAYIIKAIAFIIYKRLFIDNIYLLLSVVVDVDDDNDKNNFGFRFSFFVLRKSREERKARPCGVAKPGMSQKIKFVWGAVEIPLPRIQILSS